MMALQPVREPWRRRALRSARINRTTAAALLLIAFALAEPAAAAGPLLLAIDLIGVLVLSGLVVTYTRAIRRLR